MKTFVFGFSQEPRKLLRGQVLQSTSGSFARNGCIGYIKGFLLIFYFCYYYYGWRLRRWSNASWKCMWSSRISAVLPRADTKRHCLYVNSKIGIKQTASLRNYNRRRLRRWSGTSCKFTGSSQISATYPREDTRAHGLHVIPDKIELPPDWKLWN